MKTRILSLILCVLMLVSMIPVSVSAADTTSGTWGGIDWTLTADGTLTIAPTKGTPVPDKNAPTKRTYEVGEWREAVVYKSNGSASAIGGYPYNVKAVKKLIIEEGVTTIGSFTAQFPNLTGEVVIPSTVTYIGQEAFHKAPITKLTFAAGGTEGLCIANGAFKKLSIEEVALPGDREYIHIHHWAFGGCAKLKTAYLPANITKLWGGEHVDYFDNFNSQSNVTWANYSCLFSGDAALETVTFEDEAIRDMFFAHDNGVTSTNSGAYNGDYIVAYVGLTAYSTLQAAVDAAEAVNGTVVVVKSLTKGSVYDFTVKADETLIIPENVTLNTNGKTIYNYGTIINMGTISGEGAIVNNGCVGALAVEDIDATVSVNPVSEITLNTNGTHHWYALDGSDEKLMEAVHATGNGWVSTEDGHHYVCDVCDTVYGQAEHTPESGYRKDATGHWHYCTVCQGTYGFEAHTEGDWIVDTEPEVGVEGSQHKECTICGYSPLGTEEIPALKPTVNNVLFALAARYAQRFDVLVSAENATVNGDMSIKYKRNGTVNIDVAEGYKIVDVIANGQSLGAVETVTFKKVTAPQTLVILTELLGAE